MNINNTFNLEMFDKILKFRLTYTKYTTDYKGLLLHCFHTTFDKPGYSIRLS